MFKSLFSSTIYEFFFDNDSFLGVDDRVACVSSSRLSLSSVSLNLSLTFLMTFSPSSHRSI